MSQADVSNEIPDPVDELDPSLVDSLLGVNVSPGCESSWGGRAASGLSLVVGLVLIVCVAALATGYFSSAKQRVDARAKHSTHALDWLLWFGGAKNDQTFEKFIKDSSAKSQREWEERYRESPAYKFGKEGIDFKKLQLQVEPLPAFGKTAPRKR